MLTPCFLFSLTAVLLGQTTPLVFFLIVLVWRLLQRRCDGAGGVALAWLTIKPQLTTVLLLAVFLWLVRQRRWAVLRAFAITLALLCLASWLVIPGWITQLLYAPQQTPSPTEHFPWIGNTWFLLLRTAGLEGWPLRLLYVAVALPVLLGVVTSAVRPRASVEDVFAGALLAAFFIAPYARHYDFPVLLVPLFVLLSSRRVPYAAGALLVAALLVLPYVQVAVLGRLRDVYAPMGKFLFEATYFWIPLVLAVAWLAARVGRRQPAWRLPNRPVLEAARSAP